MNPSAPPVRRTIFIDALSALQGGGQTYLLNLLKFMPPATTADCRVIVLVPYGSEAVFRVNPAIEVMCSAHASRNVLFRLLWSKLFLPKLLRRLNAAVLYCPGGFVSVFGRWKTAVAFRNMLPFSPEERKRYPLGYTRTRLSILRWVQSRSFRRADLVIFISLFAKSIIDVVVGARAGISTVIPHGTADHFRLAVGTPGGLALPERYVCYVSILDVYKAQLEVVKAWHLLRSRRRVEEKLLLVGATGDQYALKVAALIEELGLQDEVRIVGNIAYEALPGLYQGAAINLFASSCENCPNILLEALAAGRPVLTSDYQPMPEFAADAALYFDPYAPETLATQLQRVMDDPVLQKTMGRQAAARSRDFRWDESARRTWTALRDLAHADPAMIDERV